jgi:carboxypeptidase C (cathepsin A)
LDIHWHIATSIERATLENIIFLDAPVGTGFSYAKSWEGYNITDTLSADEI